MNDVSPTLIPVLIKRTLLLMEQAAAGAPPPGFSDYRREVTHAVCELLRRPDAEQLVYISRLLRFGQEIEVWSHEHIQECLETLSELYAKAMQACSA